MKRRRVEPIVTKNGSTGHRLVSLLQQMPVVESLRRSLYCEDNERRFDAGLRACVNLLQTTRQLAAVFTTIEALYVPPNIHVLRRLLDHAHVGRDSYFARHRSATADWIARRARHIDLGDVQLCAGDFSEDDEDTATGDRVIVNTSEFASCINVRTLRLEWLEQLVDADCLGLLPHLEVLKIESCPSFQRLHSGPGTFPSLRTLYIEACPRVRDISGLANAPRLEHVTLDYNVCITNFQALRSSASTLQRLHISSATALQSLAGLEQCAHLKALIVTDCLFLIDVSAIRTMSALIMLKLRRCIRLQDISAISHCHRLQQLDLRKCNIERLPRLDDLSSLYEMEVSGCWRLQSLSGLQGLVSLRSFRAIDCTLIDDLQPLLTCTALEELNLDHCSGLHSISGIDRLRALHTLVLDNCTSLNDVSVLDRCVSLHTLSLRRCMSLQGVRRSRVKNCKQPLQWLRRQYEAQLERRAKFRVK